MTPIQIMRYPDSDDRHPDSDEPRSAENEPIQHPDSDHVKGVRRGKAHSGVESGDLNSDKLPPCHKVARIWTRNRLRVRLDVRLLKQHDTHHSSASKRGCRLGSVRLY